MTDFVGSEPAYAMPATPLYCPLCGRRRPRVRVQVTAELIRRVRAANGSNMAVAMRLKIGKTTVQKIRSGRSYQHVS